MAAPTEINAASLGEVNAILNGHANSDGTLKSAAVQAAGGGSGGASAPDVIAPVPTGVAATDTANLQAAIDSTPEGGFLLIPGHATDKTQPYVINAALTITKHMRVEGRSASEAVTSSGGIGAATGLVGSVISQATAATDVLQLSGTGKSVKLRNLGLTFAVGIIDTNTGHGINCFPSATAAGKPEQGLFSAVWENVLVYGHDGNHYAFQLRNMLYVELLHLHSWGGGCLYIDENSTNLNSGNAVIVGLFGKVYNAGTADGIRLAATHSLGLNLLNFIRPQINITGAAATAGTQDFFAKSGAGTLFNVVVDSPDFETVGANPCTFGGRGSGIVVRNPANVTNAAAGGYDAERGDFVQFTTPGANTWVVPSGVRRVRVRCVGGGGGGGGGGTNAAASAQAGGGGGGAGLVVEEYVNVTPGSSFTATVGAGGTSGGGGTVGGNAGSQGGAGGSSDFGGNVVATGGTQGKAGQASTAAAANGGVLGGGASGQSGSAVNIPGNGGPSNSPSIPLDGVVGGAGGGQSSTTNGGGAGGAATGAFPASGVKSQGTTGGSGTANGVAGTTATTPGSGGGGGGGAPSGGTGGAGGAGAPGMVEISW